MGEVGSGKTRIFNKVCHTSRESGWSLDSLTRGLSIRNSAHIHYPFTAIDTPGTNSKNEKAKHAFLLKAAFTCQPINAIFAVIPNHNRPSQMLETFDETVRPILSKNYQKKIVLVISKFDQCDIPKKQEAQKQIVKQFKDEGIDRIIFSSLNTPADQIAFEMHFQMLNMEKDQLEYSEKDFFSGFEIYSETREQKKVYDQFKNECDELIQNYSTIPIQAQSQSEKDDIILWAIIQCNRDLEEVIRKFEQKFGHQMIDLQYYAYYIRLQKYVYQIQKKFRDDSIELLSYNPDDMTDPLNLIKKCPQCKEVWIKVSGCDGETFCGNRADYLDDTSKCKFGAYSKYIFKKIGGCFQWFKAENKPKEIIQKKSSDKNGIGCKFPFVWQDLPRMDKKELEQLFEVKNIDDIIEFVTSRYDFQQSYNIQYQSVDKRFDTSG